MQERSPYLQVFIPALLSLQMRKSFWLASGLALCYWGWGGEVRSQIVPDGSLSTNVTTPDNLNFTINEGNRAGNNLFHSFSEFSIPTGGEAFFNNSVDIQNIFSRVTGNSISNIDGLIRANGTANLFLLNPNGIIFGPNAQLNIGGSFLASTASGLRFADGTFWSTANPQASPLLTISVPVGLQFGANAGSITVSNNNRSYPPSLQVQPDRTLALVASGVKLENSYLRAEQGRIELGSVGSPSLVSLIPNEQGYALGYEAVQNFQDIEFYNPIDNFSYIFSYISGDNIQLRGRQVRGLDSLARKSMTVTASELVELGGYDYGALLLAGEDLTITTPRLSVRNGTTVTSFGNLTVNASESVEVIGSSLSTNSNFLGNSAGGNLTITTRHLTVRDGATIFTSTSGAGDAGDLIVRASESVKVSGEGGIFALTSYNSTGKGGNLTIETQRLEGTSVGALSLGQGSPGRLTINTVEPLPTIQTQIVPDRTLPNNSIVRSDFNSSIIEGGTQVGSNLFHSFTEFSIPSLSVAYFNNTPDIQNIISRVTGNSVSNIDGFIRANGTTNLFLLNPNGIIFGRNAVLNIGGSFLGSTASSLNFDDGSQFSAIAPEFTPSLTMNLPTGLQFASNPASIISQSNYLNLPGIGLQVQPGKSLTLVGGDIKFEGGYLNHENGRVELGGIAVEGTVGLNVNGNNLRLSFPDNITLADISFNDGSRAYNGGFINFSSEGSIQIEGKQITLENFDMIGDSIQVQGKQITLEKNSSMFAHTDLSVTASESVDLRSSRLSGRKIAVQTGSLLLDAAQTENFYLESSISSFSGNITINARDSVEVNDSSLYTNTLSEESAGNITIQTGRLIVRNGGILVLGTSGDGPGGNLTIKATEFVEVSGKSASGRTSQFFAGSGGDVNGTVFGGKGDAGNINIETGRFVVRDGASVIVSSYREGNAGSVTVKADSIDLDNAATLTANTKGGGGDINLTTQSLIIRDGSSITTNAEGKDIAGGNINLNLDNGVLAAFKNSDITANSADFRGGNVTINTRGIFGIEFRDMANDRTSDITAIGADSSLSGTVTINIADVDPSSGLLTLPDNLVDATRLVASSCSRQRREQSQFIVTGRGGLPPNPIEGISDEATWIDLTVNSLSNRVAGSQNPNRVGRQSTVNNSPIVEAQGWTINSSGQVELVAQAPTGTPHNSGFSQPQCYAP